MTHLTIVEFEAWQEPLNPEDIMPRPEEYRRQGLSLPEWEAVCLGCFLADCVGVKEPGCPARWAYRRGMAAAVAEEVVATVCEVGEKLPLDEAERWRLYEWLAEQIG